MDRIDASFKISARGSTVGHEVRGGVVTSYTMAYIVAFNLLILGYGADADGKFLGGGAGPNPPAVAAPTALVACVMTVLMGLVANHPLALATAGSAEASPIVRSDLVASATVSTAISDRTTYDRNH